MSPSQKLEQVCSLTQTVQQLALLDVRRRHPHADPREQALRVASRWIDPELIGLSSAQAAMLARGDSVGRYRVWVR